MSHKATVDAVAEEHGWKARRHLACLQRAGVVHATKRIAARRTRRTARQNLRQYAF